MNEKLSPEELQRISARVAAEVLQKVAQTLTGELAGEPGITSARKQWIFTCPETFACSKSYSCTQNFTSLTQPVISI